MGGCVKEMRLDGVGHYHDKKGIKNSPRCGNNNCVPHTWYESNKWKVHVCPECMEQFYTL